MPEGDAFPFEQAIAPAPAPATPAASAAPATPQQRSMAEIAAPAVQRMNPLQQIGFVLQSVAAGMQGRELPAVALARQQMQVEQGERQGYNVAVDALQRGRTLMRAVPEAQRDQFIEQYGAPFERAFPNFRNLLRMTSSEPDAEALLNLFADHREIMAPLVARLGLEETIRLAQSPAFAERINNSADARNRPVVAQRLAALQTAMRSGASAGLIPPEIADRAQMPMDATVDAIIGRESNGRADARNPRSSATGAGQFIDSTWRDMTRRHGQELGVQPGMTDQQIMALRNDPAIARRATSIYARENAERLTQAGVTPDPTNIYLAHFLGPEGAVRLLRADPSQPVTAAVSAEAYAANPGVFQANGQPLTVGQVRQNVQQDILSRIQPRDGQGMSLGQFEAVNAQAPEGLRLTTSEMGTLRRSPELMLAYGIIPPAIQARMAEARVQTQEAAARERPEIREVVNENGSREFVAIDPRTARVVGRIDAGRFTGSSEFERLAAIPPERRSTEQQARMTQLISRQGQGLALDFDESGRLIGIRQGEGVGMTPAQAGQQQQRLQESEITARTGLDLIGRMREQIPQAQTGMTAWLVNNLNGMSDQISQAIEAAGGRIVVPEQIRNAQYNLSGFGEAAARNTQFRANVVRLGYLIARSDDPSGRLSNADVQNALNTLGASGALTSREQIMAALNETATAMRRNFRTRWEATRRGEPLPEWAREPAAGAAPAQPGGTTAPQRFRLEGGRLVPVPEAR